MNEIFIRIMLLIFVCVLNGMFWTMLLPSSVSGLICIFTGGMIGWHWGSIFEWLKKNVLEKKNNNE